MANFVHRFKGDGMPDQFVCCPLCQGRGATKIIKECDLGGNVWKKRLVFACGFDVQLDTYHHPDHLNNRMELLPRFKILKPCIPYLGKAFRDVWSPLALLDEDLELQPDFAEYLKWHS